MIKGASTYSSKQLKVGILYPKPISSLQSTADNWHTFKGLNAREGKLSIELHKLIWHHTCQLIKRLAQIYSHQYSVRCKFCSFSILICTDVVANRNLVTKLDPLDLLHLSRT